METQPTTADRIRGWKLSWIWAGVVALVAESRGFPTPREV